MSILKDILNKLLHRGALQPQAGGANVPAADTADSVGTHAGAAQPVPGASAPKAGEAAGATGTPLPASLSQVDVEGVMNWAAQDAGQPLNGRTSIVETLKALGIDSGLEHRKALAKELNYPGDTNDSVAMNTWLHKRVMQELANNGGKLSTDLTD